MLAYQLCTYLFLASSLKPSWRETAHWNWTVFRSQFKTFTRTSCFKKAMASISSLNYSVKN